MNVARLRPKRFPPVVSTARLSWLHIASSYKASRSFTQLAYGHKSSTTASSTSCFKLSTSPLICIHVRLIASMPSTRSQTNAASSSSADASTSAMSTSDTALRQRKATPSTVEAKREHSTSSKDSHEGHAHSHGIFGHTHSHGADSDEAQALAAAFSGNGDRGSRIILLGLASNIGLTIAKGVGGVMLHSASLLADAGHSLSDLLGDVVVLFSWRLSRRPASKAFQYGYGKFEALGSLLVATLLVGGALGIGGQLEYLSPTMSNAFPQASTHISYFCMHCRMRLRPRRQSLRMPQRRCFPTPRRYSAAAQVMPQKALLAWDMCTSWTPTLRGSQS